MKGIKILSTGHYAPSKVVSNDDLAKVVETSDEWIKSRTGIANRHISVDQNTSELAYLAAKDAIEKGQIDTSKIKYILVATFTPDDYTPSTACIVQKKLGLNDQEIMAFDINAACSGFVYSLNIIKGMLQKDEYAILIGSEVISKLIDWQDRGTCILFGDGAGAAVVEGSDNRLFYSYNNSTGNEEALYCKGRTFNNETEGCLYMDGREVFKFAVDAINKSIANLLSQSGLTLDDIDYVVCHQANYRIISHVYKKLKADPSKFFMNLQEYGNTSAASIPMALSEMNEQGLLKENQKIICVGFGSGLTWGATLFEW